MDTKGPRPVVYAEWIKPVEEGATKRPTVLIYGHYDVQPVDPLDEWKYPPFELVAEHGLLYGRGADDNKGSVMIAIQPVDPLDEWKYPPFELVAEYGLLYGDGADDNKGGDMIAIRYAITEEEIFSPFLGYFLKDNKKLLSANFVLSTVGLQISENQGAVTLGTRGVVAVEIKVLTSGLELHSGLVGGSVANPNHVLAEVISKMHDPKTAKVLVPGFYDGITSPSTEEMASAKAFVVN
eukprot:gene15494-21579_t